MDVKVNLDTQAVDQAIAQAIINAALGQKLKECVERYLKDENRYSGNLEKQIGECFDKFIKTEIEKWVITSYGDLVRERIKEKITQDMVDKMVLKACETMWRGY